MSSTLRVLDGIELKGGQNVDATLVLGQIRHAIRQGHPQVWQAAEKPDRVVLVGGGPSLMDTEDELVALVREGCVLVTLNGAYHWCLERNLKPSAQIVLDARASTARFVTPEVPRCVYYVASQCHADVWAAVEDYRQVGIYHALGEDDATIRAILDDFFAGQWQGVPGATTVATRAIGLLRMIGYLRFDLFGIDSCWMGDQHHAFPQPENERDERYRVRLHPSDQPDMAREFLCAPWHLKQFEDLILFMRHLGQHVSLHVHGDGMFAYAIRSLGSLSVSVEKES